MRRGAIGPRTLQHLALALCGIVLVLAEPSAARRPRTEPLPSSGPEQSVPQPIPSRYIPPSQGDVIIVGATVLDGAGGRLKVGEILIRDGKIAAYGPSVEHPAGARVIDARGRWITPGLIDVHTHYGTYLMPQSAAETDASDVLEASDPNVADTWIEHAVRPADPAFSYALASGVTTVQILPGSSALFGGRSVVVKPIPAVTIDQMKFPGAPQGLKMACGGNPAASFGGRGRFPNSRQGEIAGVRRAFLDAQHYRAEWQRFTSGEDHREPRRDLRLDTLVSVLEGQIPVHLHCYRADDIANWISVLGEFGVKITTVHHASEAYKIAPLLAEKGVCAAVWSDWWGFKREAEDAIPENAAFIDAAGGCVMMHSDIPVLGSLLNIEAAKAASAGRRAGIDIPPEHVIEWITSNPAKALGLDDRIGKISPGYNADLVVWSGDPFSIYSKPDLVLIDGGIVLDRNAPGGTAPSDFELGRTQKDPVR